MAIIPPQYLDTVVALGIKVNDGTFQSVGTGFLYGHPVGIDVSDGEQWFKTCLVTNRHVIEGVEKLYARFNRPRHTASHPFPLYTDDNSVQWTFHPNSADVAVTPISVKFLEEQGIEFAVFQEGKHTLSRQQACDNEIGEGSGVFVLGFPLGLGRNEQNYVIVRQGIVARIQDWLQGYADDFLIDSSIFPGNSGGPVLTEPSDVHIIGTQSFMRCCLIGMVSSYIPYQEIAVSTQTGKQRMIFEENSGLGVVVPIDHIQETVAIALSGSE